MSPRKIPVRNKKVTSITKSKSSPRGSARRARPRPRSGSPAAANHAGKRATKAGARLVQARGWFGGSGKSLPAVVHAFQSVAQLMRHEILFRPATDRPQKEFVGRLFRKFGRFLHPLVPNADWLLLVFEKNVWPGCPTRAEFYAVPLPVAMDSSLPLNAGEYLYQQLKEKKTPIYEEVRNPSAPKAGLCNAFGYPLLIGGRMIGGLIVGSSGSNRKFQAEDRSLMQLFVMLWAKFWLEKQWRLQQNDRPDRVGESDKQLVLA